MKSLAGSPSSITSHPFGFNGVGRTDAAQASRKLSFVRLDAVIVDLDIPADNGLDMLRAIPSGTDSTAVP
jgi:hypothetical protein